MELLLFRAMILPIFLLLISSSPVYIVAQDCGNKITKTIVVDKSGKAGGFTKIQEAIDSIDGNNKKWVKVQIHAATYTEKVQIPYNKPCIYLEGEDRESTIITYNDHQQTDTSATFSSFPDNIIARGITFKNSYNLENQDRKVVPAVAARIYGDKCVFFDCGFIGYQDTLWDVEGRHYFKDCTIEGAIDFIFGYGQSYFENCNLNAISSGYVTAHGRHAKNDRGGFVFKGGKLSGNGQTLLGRVYGPFSRVLFYGTYLSSVVAPAGWSGWHSNIGYKANFIEAECKGPGADTSRRVPWSKKLDSSQLGKYTRKVFMDRDGWLSYLPIDV
ncbi:hypothetical protein Lal_00000110 [Lupinus albus]|uniref:Pectinesterase n=1 Tax=Lupinus albus TaxID=3870 RepID=A0A6A5LHL7_LUPAL|nr:putative pectinesterase [Lupinus albus]KAF1860697.1 hypothetical protein Lal_00000110 [Lupinus albus]